VSAEFRIAVTAPGNEGMPETNIAGRSTAMHLNLTRMDTMNQRVQDLLKKITYIEADIEIQKQILFSIPSTDRKEMEQIVAVIASHKEEIKNLRQKLKEISPEDHQHIMALEAAVAEFKKIASQKKFTRVDVMQVGEDCCLQLKNQPNIPCLVKARAENGGWTIITMDGQVRDFSPADVDELPEDSLPC
jgi:hypothetical protein